MIYMISDGTGRPLHFAFFERHAMRWWKDNSAELNGPAVHHLERYEIKLTGTTLLSAICLDHEEPVASDPAPQPEPTDPLLGTDAMLGAVRAYLLGDRETYDLTLSSLSSVDYQMGAITAIATLASLHAVSDDPASIAAAILEVQGAVIETYAETRMGDDDEHSNG